MHSPLINNMNVHLHVFVMQNLGHGWGMEDLGMLAFFIQVSNLNKVIMSNFSTTMSLKFISEIVFIFIVLNTQLAKERKGVIMAMNYQKKGK